MRFADFVQSQNLQIHRYRNIDHFRQGLRGASVDFVPLANVDAPLGQAVLSLPGCDLYLLETFPRIVHALLESSGAFIMLSMKDRPSAIFNGKEADPSTLQFARGPVEYRAVEREPGYFAALAFSPFAEDRGWPGANGEFLTIPISRGLELRLRELIRRLFATVSRNPDWTSISGVGAGLTDSLLEALDLVFDGYLSARSSGKEKFRDGLQALRTIDDLMDSGSCSPLYSSDIAARLGVSVRTLNNLMARTNGMSLHRYVRLRRLWKVRRQLLVGDPGRQIKEIALANGFWHFGDFAANYFSQFGELPSSTQMLAQSRR
jgi:AraC family ethanolamine operon transcriptional activator